MAKEKAPNKAKDLPPMTAEAAAAIDAGIAEPPKPERFERTNPRAVPVRGKPAGERLFRWDHNRAVAVLAYAPGDPVREDDNDVLFGEDELAEAEGRTPRAVTEAIEAGTDAATRQRQTGDTYDRRAAEEGLPTEAQQRLEQEQASAARSKPTAVERAQRARAPKAAPKKEG